MSHDLERAAGRSAVYADKQGYINAACRRQAVCFDRLCCMTPAVAGTPTMDKSPVSYNVQNMLASTGSLHGLALNTSYSACETSGDFELSATFDML